jgi:phage/plasmid-like protein (TIGR03299 family)
MSHEFTSGVMAHGQRAWHGLGEVITGTLPAPEMFQRAGALFPVETLQLRAGDISDDELLDELATASDQEFSSPEERRTRLHEILQRRLISLDDTRKGVWRPDTRRILGTSGPDYRVIPNQRLLDFASALREEVDMDTVVVLREGAKVAFTAKIRGTDAQVSSDDKIYRNIVGYLGHDGSTGFGGLFSDIRVVCANTLGYARSDADRHGRQFSIRHTDNDIAQIDDVLANIDIARQSFIEVVDEYRAMRDVPMNTDLYRHWLEQVYQVPDAKLDDGSTRPGSITDMPRKWAQLEHAWNYGLGRDTGTVGTLYWGLNCVTEVETSQLTKGAGKRRMHSTLFGSGKGVVTRANTLARELMAAV